MPAAKSRVPEHSRQRLYSVRDLMTTLNVSRHTLLYYEELGIVSPERDEGTGYRWYTPDDIFRLMSSILLKNIGTPPKDLSAHLDGEPFAPARMTEYREAIERRIEYCRAQLECMDALGGLVDSLGVIEDRYVEPYYISYDRAETGYHDFPDDEGLVSLLQNMPIGGLGSREEACSLDAPGSNRWGRTVAVRFAHLIPGLPVERLEVMGGCRCVCMALYDDDIFCDDYAGGYRPMRDYIDGHGLRVVGRPFCPYSLPSDHGFHMLRCVPVEAAQEA